MISSATVSHINLLPLRPPSAVEIANQKGGEENSRKRTAPADTVRGLGPGVPRSLLDLSTLAGLDQQDATENLGEEEAGRLPGRAQEGEEDARDAAAPRTSTVVPGAELTEEQDREVADLKRADAEIRRHEAAHASAGGRYAGTPSFEYQVGPDGRRYAVAGEVPIDVSPVSGDPGATIAKMQVVKRAASAPTSPSAQDRAVAATAAKVEAEARAGLRAERAEAASGEGGAATPAAEAHLARPGSGAKDDSATPANRLSEIVAARYAETATIVGEAGVPVSVADASSAVATPRFERFA